MKWRNLHLAAGAAGLLLFVLQGQYMARVLGVPELPDVQRMLYRSAHIYFMLGCAANVCAGYFMSRRARAGPLQHLCSLLLLVAPVMLLVSFFTEVSTGTIDRPLLSIALYLLFGAAVLLVLGAAVDRIRSAPRR